jgi:hypothetical protein
MSPFGTSRSGILLGDCQWGQPVALSATSMAVNLLIPITTATVMPWGIVAFNIKDSHPVAGNVIEIATFGAVVWERLTANITAGTPVQYDSVGNGVRPLESDGIPFGIAEKSGNTGDLIKVMITCPINILPSGGGTVNEIITSVVVADWQQAEPGDPYTIDISIADTGIGDTFVASFISNAGEYHNLSYSIANGIVTVGSNVPRDGKISIFG